MQLHQRAPCTTCNAHSHRSQRHFVVARAGAPKPSTTAKAAKDVTGLSSLRFGKPSDGEMQQLMSDWVGKECNHDFPGASVGVPVLPQEVSSGGFMITKTRRQVGSGQATYQAAVAAIKQWSHLQLGWNTTTTPAMKTGATICSATQTVVPWSVLPARVTYLNEGTAQFGGKPGKRFAIGMCSLEGHQLAGEERFAVELLPDGSVWYDVFLFSKPDTLLALVSLPVVKLQQIRYVNDSAAAVAKAVAA